MNVYWRELRSNFRSLCFWCIGLLSLLAVGMWASADLSDINPSWNELASHMTPALNAIIGEGDFNLSRASGYYGIMYSFLLLAAAMYAVLLGSGIIAKEERKRTAEFLYSKPVSRAEVLWAKLFAAVTQLLIFCVVIWAGSVITVEVLNDGESFLQEITVLMIGMLLVQLLFMSFGMALSAVCRGAKRSSGIGVGLLFTAYLIAIAINMNESLEGITIITPFKYINTADILSGGGLNAEYAGASLLLFVLFTLITFVGYRKRDLRV